MVGLLIGVLTGYPLALVIGAVAVIVGYSTLGFQGTNSLAYQRIYGIVQNYTLLAIPLFIFMGSLLENSGIIERLYSALYLWFAGLRGGLALITIWIGTAFAACIGVMAASVTLLSLVALPSMLKRGYDKSLATGCCCAGGTLGILIPPSVMLVIYGPMAQISVGKLFMGAFGPGLLLSALYSTYILARCYLQPKLGPAVPIEERRAPFFYKCRYVLTSAAPTGILILAVLGTIFFGIAPPTEAAAMGAVVAILLTIAYRRFNLQNLRNAANETLKVTSFAMFVAASSIAFVGVFMAGGGDEVIRRLILSFPYGNWAVFAMIHFVIFILGFFIDFIGILFIIVPILSPIIPALGFDPLWFAITVCVNFQTSFNTPPLAFAIFYVLGTSPPEFGVTSGDIIRGVIPFIILIFIGLALCVLFPEIILWLPSMMRGA